jgi:uncharacterized protein
MSAHPTYYSPYDEIYWTSIADGATRIQKCKACATLRYPPGACCPECLGIEADWVVITGRGTVLSWTTLHRQYLPAYPAPSTVVVVQLEEGPIMISNIDEADRKRLKIGAPTQMTYFDHPDGYRLSRFVIGM